MKPKQPRSLSVRHEQSTAIAVGAPLLGAIVLAGLSVACGSAPTRSASMPRESGAQTTDARGYAAASEGRDAPSSGPSFESSPSAAGHAERSTPQDDPSTTAAGPRRGARLDSENSRGDSWTGALAKRSAESSGMPDRASVPAPRERQGLGTEWGETRDSRTYEMSFVRNDSERPYRILSVKYNDRQGVDAMLAHQASRPSFYRGPVFDSGDVTMTIRDGSDSAFENFRTSDDSYVIGQAGERYTIVLTNTTGRRIEAVATVDGLDVINGKAGIFRNRGYILMPYSTVEIDGFRQSQASVAAFRFGAVGASYAAQKGNDRHVGVIGVALFNERGDYPDARDLRLRETANPFPQQDPRYAAPPRR